MQRTSLLANVFMDLVLTMVFLVGAPACPTSSLSREPATATSTPATRLASATPIREPSPPPNCSPLEITQLIDNFAKAYDAGSFEQITLYLDLYRFESFVGGTKPVKSYEAIRTKKRTQLFSFFAHRHRPHHAI